MADTTKTELFEILDSATDPTLSYRHTDSGWFSDNRYLHIRLRFSHIQWSRLRKLGISRRVRWDIHPYIIMAAVRYKTGALDASERMNRKIAKYDRWLSEYHKSGKVENG